MAEPMRLQCKNCGGELDTAHSAGRVVKCPYCGATYLLPKEETGGKARTLLTLGEQYLYTADFEGAYAAYEKAAGLQADEPEAYFGMALAKAKVQFLYDHVNKRLQPICHALGEGKFSDDKNYKKALALAEREQREEYERRAEEIDEIRIKFRSFEEAGLDYDCFLCAKVTEEDGKRHTEDSFIAAQIFSELKKEGYAPFYSEEEIKGRTGSDYEARILYALYKSECMLLVCSNEDYLQTPWVKNEYMRFLRLVNDEEKESDAITFVFQGKPVERIPGRKGKVQGINFSDGTAIKRIEEFVSAHTPEARKRREEEKKRKAEEEELKNRVFTEWLRKQTEESEGKKRAEEAAKRAEEERKREEVAAAEAKRKEAEKAESIYRKALKLDETKKYAEAFSLYMQAALLGLARAQFNLGNGYYNGQGVTQSYEEAVKWYRKAAEQGYADAQYNLGVCYYHGQGVTQSYKEAVKWFRKAAEQGQADAQCNLGYCYEKGEGVTQSYEEAVKWYRKAAEQGHARAITALKRLEGK